MLVHKRIYYLKRQKKSLEWDLKWAQQQLIGRKRNCPTSREIYEKIEDKIQRIKHRIKSIDLELLILE